MWIMTTRGFFSVVQRQSNPNEVKVRARREEDIRSIAALIPGARPYATPERDYLWRFNTTKAQWAKALARLANEIDYTNFKDEVYRKSKRHAGVYGEVWSTLYLGLDERGAA